MIAQILLELSNHLHRFQVIEVMFVSTPIDYKFLFTTILVSGGKLKMSLLFSISK